MAVDVEAGEVMEIMRKRVDRLMKAVQLEVEDGDLRVNAITKLLELRTLFGEDGNGERSSN